MSERGSRPDWLIVVALMGLGFAIVAVLGLIGVQILEALGWWPPPEATD